MDASLLGRVLVGLQGTRLLLEKRGNSALLSTLALLSGCDKDFSIKRNN